MRRIVTLAVLLATAAQTTACLQKDTTHTLCLSPDGAVTWIAEESRAFSDASDAARRAAEEQEYVAAALESRHDIGLALEALRPLGDVRTTVLRDRAPLFVVTEARYESVEAVMRRLLEDAPAAVTVKLSKDGPRSTLTAILDFGVELRERDTSTSHILADLDRLRIVLTDGRFVSAAGFDVTDGRVATFAPESMRQAENGEEGSARLELALAWER